jgi:hypothetical protein
LLHIGDKIDFAPFGGSATFQQVDRILKVPVGQLSSPYSIPQGIHFPAWMMFSG